MRLLIDENIPRAACFERFGEVRLAAGRSIRREELRDIDALIVRSVTRVDADLLEGTAVRFVGSTTAGTDHVGLESLHALGIHFANAPGSNADSVVDYVLAGMATLLTSQRELAERTVGIVGCGQVGSRLLRRLHGLAREVRVCDPFLVPGSVAGLAPLEHALDADIVTLHTPLTRSGPHPTYHLVDASRLAGLRADAVLINSARGAVIDQAALIDVLQRRDDLRVVLDVFEHEPQVSAPLLTRANLLTPHIAGHASDGKLRGTEMVFRALSAYLQQAPQWTDDALARTLDIAALGPVAYSDLPFALLRHCYDLSAESEAFRCAMSVPGAGQSRVFDGLRRDYPIRREFGATQIVLPQGFDAGIARLLQQLGFRLARPAS